MSGFSFRPSRTGRLRNFGACDSGNVTVTFALALIPIIGFMGAAVDYSRANSAKAAMQAAIDATTLTLSKEASTLSSAKLAEKADAYFKANFNRPEVINIAITPTFTTAGGSQLTIKGTGTLSTNFMGLLGFSNMTIGAESQVKWGSARLRVALVLDTTGSMASDGKMNALKSATKDMLKQLEAAASTNGDVYVSIIPFSKNVNVGSSNHSANWIDWTDWESEPDILKNNKPNNFDDIGAGDNCPFSTYSHGFRCAAGPTSTSIVNSIPSNGSYKGWICPSSDTGQKDSKLIGRMYNGCYVPTTTTEVVSTGRNASCGWTSNCSCSGSGNNKVCTKTTNANVWTVNAKTTWNGCVTDRGTSNGPSDDYDRKVTAPSSAIKASLFPAEQDSNCSPPVTGLNYNWNTMKNTVDALYPLGATNQPIGLVWGWQSLVGGGLFSVPAKDPKYKYEEVIVLMSDGMNTLNRWDGNGSSTNTNVDKRMYQSSTIGTCANIKASGVTIYTIHVNTNNDPKSTLLENCASTSDKFFLVNSASGLAAVFNTIGTNLTKLRLAK